MTILNFLPCIEQLCFLAGCICRETEFSFTLPQPEASHPLQLWPDICQKNIAASNLRKLCELFTALPNKFKSMESSSDAGSKGPAYEVEITLSSAYKFQLNTRICVRVCVNMYMYMYV